MLIRPGCVYLQHQHDVGRFSREKWRKRSNLKSFTDRRTLLIKSVCGEPPLVVFYWTQMSKEDSAKASALRLLTIMQRWRQTVFGYWYIAAPGDRRICQSALTKKRYRSAFPLKAVDVGSRCSGAHIYDPASTELNPIKYGFHFRMRAASLVLFQQCRFGKRVERLPKRPTRAQGYLLVSSNPPQAAWKSVLSTSYSSYGARLVAFCGRSCYFIYCSASLWSIKMCIR